MRAWKRTNKIDNHSSYLTIIDENLYCRYFLIIGRKHKEQIAECDLSRYWVSINQFLEERRDFEAVSEDELQRFLEIESSDSKTERI